MRRGFLLSLLFHFSLILAFAIKLPDFILPEEKVTFIDVKLVASPDAAKTAKPKEVTPVKTQQSSAPPAPPKPKAKPQEAPKSGAKLVQKTESPVKQKVEEKKDSAEKEASKSDSRPEKLDKTKNKKNIIAEKGKPNKKQDEQFLAALDFIDDLEGKESALAVDEEATETTVYDGMQSDIANLKTHIEKNWYRTPGIANLSELAVIVRVHVGRDGSISRLEVVQGSGKTFFDNSLLRAVRKSVPLPIPADRYDVFKTIELRFNG